MEYEIDELIGRKLYLGDKRCLSPVKVTAVKDGRHGPLLSLKFPFPYHGEVDYCPKSESVVEGDRRRPSSLFCGTDLWDAFDKARRGDKIKIINNQLKHTRL